MYTTGVALAVHTESKSNYPNDTSQAHRKRQISNAAALREFKEAQDGSHFAFIPEPAEASDERADVPIGTRRDISGI
jgi:hypothetical protein